MTQENPFDKGSHNWAVEKNIFKLCPTPRFLSSKSFQAIDQIDRVDIKMICRCKNRLQVELLEVSPLWAKSMEVASKQLVQEVPSNFFQEEMSLPTIY